MRKLMLKGIFAFSVLLLFGAARAEASRHPYLMAQNTEGQSYYREIEISKFQSREEAERLAKKIRNGGFETIIRTDVTEKDKKTYRVFVLVHERDSQSMKAVAMDAGEGPEGTTEEDRPIGTLKNSEDLFGRKTSFFHPSLSVTEEYTDNAFYTKSNKKSDWSTTLTPEVWVALPRINQKYLVFEDTSNRFAGGLILGRYRPEVIRRYQTYLLYRADIPIAPSKNSRSGNTVSHNVYGSAFYNGNIFSAGVLDQFARSYETRGFSIATQEGEVDRYNSNLFHVMTHFDTGNRTRLRFDYSNFYIDYDAPRNNFRNRMDNGFAAYLFYKLQPKTSIFAEYDFIDIGYRSYHTLDNREHHFFGGVQWDITAKSRGIVKGGYGIKDFVNLGEKDNDFIVEAQISHHFSPKTTVTLTAFRKTAESAVQSTLFAVTSEVGLNYRQILTSRLTSSANVYYTRDRYRNAADSGRSEEIEDNTYQAGFGLHYDFQKRLKGSIGYTYTKRDSNFSEFDYASNTLFFRVQFAP